MQIAQAAARIGVPTHRLRHYEATALLVPDRTPTGYRVYSPADVERGRRIAALLDSGFTAADVALMLPCMSDTADTDVSDDDPRRCCAVTRARLVDRLAQIRDRRIALERTEAALSSWLAHPDPTTTV